MKTTKTITTMLLLLFAFTINAQSIEKFSIDSGGASSTAGGIEILYTIGEVNVQELNVGGIIVSEGFINPEKCSGATTTWDGISWDKGIPDNKMEAIIAGEYISNVHGNIDACSVRVNSGFVLTITAGNYVSVENNIIVDGTLLVAHEGSLVQINDLATVTNLGSITVIKTTPVSSGNSFSILGSPMSSITRNGAYLDNNVVMNHTTTNFLPHQDVTDLDPFAEHFADDNGDDWSFITGSVNINPGEGYLVGPTTASVGSGFYDINYSQGTLNNGIFTYNIDYNIIGTSAENKSASPNILSNPYASALDADLFIISNTVIDEIYFWEHLTAPSSSYPGYRFENWSMGDISIRNIGGSLAAPNGGAIPTQFIPSGQGFGIKANSSEMVTFNNSMRVTGDNTGYRSLETDRMYLELKNETYNLKSTTLISFTSDATDGYDPQYDSKRLATAISIYSVLDEKELAIQGKPVFNIDQIIPIGFRTMIQEQQAYTISLGNLEGDNINNASVYLQDNLLNTRTNLSETNYLFTSNESNQKDRFVIVFIDDQLGNNEYSLEKISLYPNPTNKTFTISSPLSEINSIEIYDIRGRKIMYFNKLSTQTIKIDLSLLKPALYHVRIITSSGSITKKVIKQ